MKPYLAFKRVAAVPTSLVHVNISWSMELTPVSLAPYRFRILRSQQGLLGPYDTVLDAILPTVNSISDSGIELASKLKSFIWWVELYELAGPFVLRSEPIYIAQQYDQLALAMIDKAYLLLSNPSKGVGIDCVLHNLKSWGTRCPICWDPIKMKMKISNCEACFGSGFEDGYFTPVPIKLSMDPGQFGVQLRDQTAVETAQHRAWTVAAPPIDTNDVITDIITDSRYRVVNQSVSVKRGAPLRQFLTLTMLTRSSIEYNLPII